MEEFQVYTDIASRTNGEIYLGVCGPVRTRQIDIYQAFYGAFGASVDHG